MSSLFFYAVSRVLDRLPQFTFLLDFHILEAQSYSTSFWSRGGFDFYK